MHERPGEKSCTKPQLSYMKDLEKSRADNAARSHESYKKDLEKRHDDSAARSRESYLMDPVHETVKVTWWI